MAVDAGTLGEKISLGVDLGVGFSIGRFLARLDAKYFPPRFSGVEGSSGKGANVSLAASAASGCYLAATGRVGVGLCGVAEGGVLLASGENFVINSSLSRPWFAAGAAVEVAAAIGGPMFLSASLGALVPATRPPVRFVPAGGESADIYTPWPIVPRAGLGFAAALE
jgi:hypothetical protein